MLRRPLQVQQRIDELVHPGASCCRLSLHSQLPRQVPWSDCWTYRLGFFSITNNAEAVRRSRSQQLHVNQCWSLCAAAAIVQELSASCRRNEKLPTAAAAFRKHRMHLLISSAVSASRSGIEVLSDRTHRCHLSFHSRFTACKCSCIFA